jgi:uncharacterized protein (TIGR03084 family)
MEDLLADLAAQHAELNGLVAALGDVEFAAPTVCSGWDVADVLLHLHQSDELALASLRGELDPSMGSFGRGGDGADVDAAAAASVAGARGATGTEVRAAWARSAADLRAAFATVDPHRRVQWVAGRLSARTLAATRLAECWLHAGDVAGAIGVELPATARLRHVARLAWRTIPYAFAAAGEELRGAVGFDLTGPDGESWRFGLDETPATVVTGDAADLCLVAGRRLAPGAASVTATGPDGDVVLALVRTYA